MFSGIVEEAARVVALRKDGGNLHITLKCSFTDELKIDQSVSHNGVCLTVVELPGDGTYTVTAIQETLDRSNLGLLKVGDEVNVERSMLIQGRLDGHIVQGHVDQTAVCIDVHETDGSWYYRFQYDSTPDMIRPSSGVSRVAAAVSSKYSKLFSLSVSWKRDQDAKDDEEDDDNDATQVTDEPGGSGSGSEQQGGGGDNTGGNGNGDLEEP